MPDYSARHRIKERRPPAPGLELVLCRVERRVAGGAVVAARGGRVLVVFAGAGRFGALLANDAELFCAQAVSWAALDLLLLLFAVE